MNSRFGFTRGRTWRHLGSFGVSRVHLVSLGITWCHSVSLGLGVKSLGVTRFHLVLLSFTSASLGFTWCHLVSPGVTFMSLGFTWCHSVSPKSGSRGFSGLFPHDLGSLGCAPPAGRSIFSPFREKRPLGITLIHFLPKTGFPGSCRYRVEC